ncbi:MAG: AAA family ATPase [Myxococcales bacterium]|nr:AAA family ATPase [Myxococcales bacterium]
MIDRVSFRNFKCLRAVDLNFGRMTVLVGANGSGKSSVLAGIHLLSQIGARVDDPFEESYPRLRRLFGGQRSAPTRASGRHDPPDHAGRGG